VVQATDALITDVPGVPLMLRFADCVPIWFYDPVRRAIGLAHAGWRGTVAGVGRATVAEMGKAFGSRPEDVIACIGPSVGPCCYEVGKDVAYAVGEAFPGVEGQLLSPRANGSWHLDLWAANRHQLAACGVVYIEVAGICTACHTDEWFSHRAEQGRTGRIGALIGLRK
jgi:YfiH family protein